MAVSAFPFDERVRNCFMHEGGSIVQFKCLPVTQPIGTFYIGAISATDLVGIAWADIRRIARDDEEHEDGPTGGGFPTDLLQSESDEFGDLDLDEAFLSVDDQDFERFLGIQRELSRARVGEIKQYVNTQDAAFPTSVLIAVSSRYASFDETTSTVSILRHGKAAKIIDGQHRIAGLEDYRGPEFDVNVSVFIDMDLQDQAMMFATINLKQTKVNKSLAYDLYEFTKTRSPQRTAHDIARFLNYKQGSPFYSKVKMLGTGSGREQEVITQATFVDRLLRYISRNPMADRDALRRGRRLARASGTEKDRQIFRNWFIEERDVNITIVLWNYFLAVQAKWPYSWDTVVRGNVLNRTTGFGALMRFLRVAYNSRERPAKIVLRDEFLEVFEKIDLADNSFTPEEYVPGSSGERVLYDRMIEQAGLGRYR